MEIAVQISVVGDGLCPPRLRHRAPDPLPRGCRELGRLPEKVQRGQAERLREEVPQDSSDALDSLRGGD